MERYCEFAAVPLSAEKTNELGHWVFAEKLVSVFRLVESYCGQNMRILLA